MNEKDLRRRLQALGKAIRARREKFGHSQEGYAAEIEMHRTYYGGIERGERNVSFRNLLRIAEGLKIPLSELIRSSERTKKKT